MEKEREQKYLLLSAINNSFMKQEEKRKHIFLFIINRLRNGFEERKVKKKSVNKQE